MAGPPHMLPHPSSHASSHAPSMYPPAHPSQHGSSSFRSAPPAHPGPPRGLVWLPSMNQQYPDSSYLYPESSSSRNHSPLTQSPHRYKSGDDGLSPTLRDISMRFDYTRELQRCFVVTC